MSNLYPNGRRRRAPGRRAEGDRASTGAIAGFVTTVVASIVYVSSSDDSEMDTKGWVLLALVAAGVLLPGLLLVVSRGGEGLVWGIWREPPRPSWWGQCCSSGCLRIWGTHDHDPLMGRPERSR